MIRRRFITSLLFIIIPFVAVYAILLLVIELPVPSPFMPAGADDDPPAKLEGHISALIKVHKRADIAVRAAFSIYALYSKMTIVMVDDSPTPIDVSLPPTAKYFRIPENTGISFGRNYGVKLITTAYTLLMDDDWLITNETRLEDVFNLLEANQSIGIVAGMLCTKEELKGCYGYQGSLGIVDDKLTYRDKVFREKMENGCNLVDLGENAIVARTEVLKKYPWDDNLKNAEHEDFYLTMKGHVNVASCSWFKILHKRPKLDAYAGYQYDRDLWGHQNFLCKKWKLKGFDMMWNEWKRDCPAEKKE